MFPLLALGMMSSVGGGIAANNASEAQRQAALAANQAAISQWLNVHVPDPAQQQIVLQKYAQTGQIDPILETAIKQDPSSMAKIQQDAGLKGQQLKALGSLQDLGASGGMTINDKANLQGALNDTNAAAAGRSGAIQDSMAARGMGGSGLAMAAQEANAQAANNRDSQAQLQTLGSARDRALQATMGAGQLAGQISNNQFQQDAAKAQAQDSINRFNTQNSQAVNAANTGITNSAQAANVALQQGIANQNTGLANQQEIYNKGLIQQNYQNQLQQAAGASGQYNASAGFDTAGANRTAQSVAGIGAGINQGLKGIAQYDQINNYLDNLSSNE